MAEIFERRRSSTMGSASRSALFQSKSSTNDVLIARARARRALSREPDSRAFSSAWMAASTSASETERRSAAAVAMSCSTWNSSRSSAAESPFSERHHASRISGDEARAAAAVAGCAAPESRDARRAADSIATSTGGKTGAVATPPPMPSAEARAVRAVGRRALSELSRISVRRPCVHRGYAFQSDAAASEEGALVENQSADIPSNMGTNFLFIFFEFHFYCVYFISIYFKLENIRIIMEEVERKRREQKAAAASRALRDAAAEEARRSARSAPAAWAARRAATSVEAAEALPPVRAAAAAVRATAAPAAVADAWAGLRAAGASRRAAEIVVAGPVGHGKSMVVEALVGLPVLPRAPAPTRRAVEYRLVYNATAAEPICTVAGEAVPLAALPEAVARKMDSSAGGGGGGGSGMDAPVAVRIEWREYVLEAVVIDVPGTGVGKEKDEAGRRLAVRRLVGDARRRLLWVEEAREEGPAALAAAAALEELDPGLLRSSVVLTRFNSLLHELGHGDAVPALFAAYAGWALPHVFVTMPSAPQRAAAAESPDGVLALCARLDARDRADLERVSAAPADPRRLGVAALLRHVRELLALAFLDQVPELAASARAKENATVSPTSVAAQPAADSSSGDLMAALRDARGAAVAYASRLTAAFDRLVDGTVDGNARVNGQTRAEELDDVGDLAWVDGQGAVLDVPAAEVLAFEDVRLYGGQQFDRLLSEFRSVARNLDIDADEISVDQLIAASGLRRLPNGAPDFLWVACSVAALRARADLNALLHVLRQRAVHVLLRLVSTAEYMLQSDPSAAGAPALVASFIGQRFRALAEEAVAEFAERVSEDEYHPDAVYWHYSMRVDGEKFGRTLDTAMCWKVIRVARELYRMLRDHLVEDAALKAYNLLLMRLQQDAAPRLVADVLALPAADASTLYQLDAAVASRRASRTRAEVSQRETAAHHDSLCALSVTLSKELRAMVL